MKQPYDPTARKRPVNLTLNEDLVSQVKGTTGNLSAVVEALLVRHLQEHQKGREDHLRKVASAIRQWNDFDARCGSLADEYSPL